MSLLVIRRGQPSDAGALAANNRAMALETEAKVLDPAVTLRGSSAVLADIGKGFYLVAERDAHVVGQLLVTYEWSDWRDGTFWWIQSVYIVPHARRTGVYRALYAHLYAEAKGTPGTAGIRLYAERSNTQAHATYEALGMRRAHYDMFEVDFVLGSKI
jgi:GNAT superfamily N-acetyltransferase